MIGVPIACFGGLAQVWQAIKEDREGGREFKPGQGGADAKMQATAKGRVGLDRARRVKLIRILPE